MKQTFDYLENVPNIAATVCNKEGIVLYQNKRAIDRDGDVSSVGHDNQSVWYIRIHCHGYGMSDDRRYLQRMSDCLVDC